jgi:subtilisin family serine protease
VKGLVLLAGVLAAAMVLWGSAAGAAPSGSAALADSVSVARHHVSLGELKGVAEPEALNGVPAKGSYGFLLKLGTEPTGRAYQSNLSHGVSAAREAASDQLATVRTAESRVIAALPSGSHVLYRTHALLTGVGVYTKVTNLPALQRISGVAAVYPIAPKKPSLSYSVLLQREPQAWAATGDTGAGSTIAIIDTGIDYTHADFGGPGTTAAYQTALANDTATPTYPDTNKVSTESYDLAGDMYDASDPNNSTPMPDPNPLDCNGHGSHTAGIAAGYGENPDGTKFTGDYATLPTDATSYQALFRIGPGMAPMAKVYAYKIFGCAEGGTTDLVTEAIDRAADPNHDGSTADHVDVISMSLGADFASSQDADSVAANDAAQLGISVVAAAGNGGDLYDVAGSPGNARRAISVAASVDAYSQIDTLNVSFDGTPQNPMGAERSVAYDWTNKPDLSGDVVALTQSTNTDGCDPLNSTDAARVAGKIAFLEWTDDDATRRCGSAARAANVAAAGATGFIFADDEETFAAGITGSGVIPGVLVTKSAGNAIRTALASQTVTVDSTVANGFEQFINPSNDDEVASFSSRGIREAGDLKPDVSAVGASVFSTGFGTGNQGISESGTSMATPMVAGLAALIHTQYTGWTAEQVKADVMNTAGQDLFTGDTHSGNTYAPNRVGAGRIDAEAALDNEVLAYVADDPGAVSASFGPVAVTAPTTLHKTIDVVNTGGSPATYTVSYQALTSVPGATYSVSPSSFTVTAGATQAVTLTLTLDPTLLTKTIDPTVARVQDVVDNVPREYVADASGRVLFTPTAGSTVTLRVPVYSAPRPASTMTQASAITMPSGNVEAALLTLTGHGVDQGSGSTSIQSIVAGFELQAQSGPLPTCTSLLTSGCIHAADERAADLKYVGTTSDAPQLSSIGVDPLSDGLESFAITTQGPWHTAVSQNEYDIYIDSTGDGIPDYVLFNTRLTGTDTFVAALYSLTLDEVVDLVPINARWGDVDTALFDSDTLVMPVWIGDLAGVAAGHSRITYGVVTFGSFSGDPVDSVGVHISGNSLSLDRTLSTDVLNPGLAVFGSFDGSGSPLLYLDSPGTLEVRRDAASYTADHGQGALIVHFHNVVGGKAQVVSLSAVEHTLSVAKRGTGTGSVTSLPGGISCGAICSAAFAAGTSVTLTARPAANSTFGGWSGGGCSGTRTCVVALSTDTAVTATFHRDTTRPKVTRLRVKVNHRKRSARVTFRGTDPGRGSKGLRFRCKVDHRHFKSCRSPKLYKHLRRGKHTVQVKVIDRAGNVSKPVKRRFRV